MTARVQTRTSEAQQTSGAANNPEWYNSLYANQLSASNRGPSGG